jgi:C4-dicarboxylate-specific signal transduction histidine kinase
VLTNLVINAIDAIPENGKTWIHVFAKEKSFLVNVVDSGSGTDEEQRLHCLEPFYTTKSAFGKGIGPGLSMYSDIVRKHGGQIEFESESWKGISLRISLPIDEGEDMQRNSLDCLGSKIIDIFHCTLAARRGGFP